MTRGPVHITPRFDHRNPLAPTKLRALDQALQNQREDRQRAAALLVLIAEPVEDYG